MVVEGGRSCCLSGHDLSELLLLVYIKITSDGS